MKLVATAALFASLCGAASAAPAEQLPFGLDALSWKMSVADAAAAFPPLRTPGRADSDAPLTDQESRIVSSYAWKSCTFRITFYFAASGLASIFLDRHSADPQCAADALAELVAHYGAAPQSGDSVLDHRGWATAGTQATFNRMAGSLEISVVQVGGKPPTVYDTF